MALPSFTFLLAAVLLQVCQGAVGSTCDPHVLTVYKVLVQTFWSRDVFPKQYPEWRPPAQWSKVVGRSHDPSFHLFHVGEVASDGLKQFAELSQTDILDAQSQGEGGVFDEFIAPPVTQGVGETQAQFFVDGNHTKVSMMSRVVPSPDWFIGVDSLELCVEGNWIDSVVLEVDPMDAGTDNGFTFTSPNWPTVPKKPVTRITSQSPDHPANSFYYPDRDQHPPLATFHIVKVKEYQLRHTFSGSFNQAPSKKYTTDDRHDGGNSGVLQDFEVSNSILETSSVVTTPEAPEKKGDQAIMNDIVDKFKKFRKNRRGRKMGRRRSRAPRDCRLSEWSEWSSCSKTCGIGEQIRTRTVVRHSRRGGRPCPSLQETQWCGSSKDCDHKYFDW
ncbi:spondin-2-like [Macrobrachium rosenbergii]|uniref:spondin-2-like n=1 Tax=Macrobrachium rosenbergii TaxID=79674 RepID=UPI0034D41D40